MYIVGVAWDGDGQGWRHGGPAEQHEPAAQQDNPFHQADQPHILQYYNKQRLPSNFSDPQKRTPFLSQRIGRIEDDLILIWS